MHGCAVRGIITRVITQRMKTLTIDTHKVVSLLQQKGFTKEQAEGLVEAAREVDTTEIATKHDLELINLKLNIMAGLQIATSAGVFVLMLQSLTA